MVHIIPLDRSSCAGLAEFMDQYSIFSWVDDILKRSAVDLPKSGLFFMRIQVSAKVIIFNTECIVVSPGDSKLTEGPCQKSSWFP